MSDELRLLMRAMDELAKALRATCRTHRAVQREVRLLRRDVKRLNDRRGGSGYDGWLTPEDRPRIE